MEKTGEAPHFPLSSTTVMVSVCAACQTLVMEARQFDDFWSFSGCVVGGSGMVRKLNGSPILLVPMWPGLSAGFCRLLLSTMLDVLDARLSRVLHDKDNMTCSFFVTKIELHKLSLFKKKKKTYWKPTEILLIPF